MSEPVYMNETWGGTYERHDVRNIMHMMKVEEEHHRQDAGVRVQDEIGAHDPGNRAAGADHRNRRVGADHDLPDRGGRA